MDFLCGKCIENDSGLCDVLGIFVEDDDPPHCAYGKGYKNFDNYKRKEDLSLAEEDYIHG